MNRRRILFVLIAATITFFVWQQTEASYNGIPLKKSPLRHEVKLKSSGQLEEIIILPEISFDEEEARAIIYRLDHLPHSLLDKVNSQEIKVRLFTENLTDFSSTSHLKGVTPRGYTNTGITWDDVPGIGGSKLVLVKIGHSEKGMGHGSVNLELHELAHSVDRYVWNDIYYEMSFLPVWKQEAPLLFPGEDYFIQYKEEYFAETFAMYFLNLKTKKLLKEKAPATYNYFEEVKSM
jgi:Pro-Pro endopeptidase